MIVEASRLEELKSLLRNSGFEWSINTIDGNLAIVNIWIGD